MSKHSFDAWLGKSIKGYRLEEILGVGGVGCVFRATHPLIKKQVAIKILQNTDPTAKILERFFTEARAANEIRHENVIDVIDFDQTDEKTPFMIMEYLHGQSLAAAIEEEAPFTEARLCHIALQICAALSAAHTRGIIHRDLKGDNIFLTHRGDESDFVKILDFGIAKLLYANENPTQTGLMIGTPLCMAPEQALGLKVDARVDVYALGVLLFQMCTGRSPFEHSIPMVIVSMHLESPAPSPRQYNPAVSGTLEGIIARCLQKKPADRFASMEALATMLEGLQQPTSDLERPGLEAISLDMTSPFIGLSAAREAWAKPEARVGESAESQPTSLRHEVVPRGTLAPAASPSSVRVPSQPSASSAVSKTGPPDVSMMPTLIDPIRAASTPLASSAREVMSPVPLPVFATGEQTEVGEGSKKVMAEKILKTMRAPAFDSKKIAKVPPQMQGPSFLLMGVGVILAGILLAILLGIF